MQSKIQMDPAQEFIFYRTYSRWNDELKRRETWEEAIARYFNFMKEQFGDRVPQDVWELCETSFLKMEAMGSMRALWGAGPALKENNIIGYNCCSMVVKDLFSFAELFYILMCGTGVGFSVEKRYIDQLSEVKPQTGEHLGVHVVEDSRKGWADALYAGLQAWFEGKDLDFDLSRVRPKGARLKTMGGRASGPEPLKKMLELVRAIVLGAQGRKLTDLECVDIGNHIGDAVQVGGVRRASEITFSDLDSERMRHAKDFPIPDHRYMSNNSVAYLKKPTSVEFLKEWTALAASGSGERGTFNVEAAARACFRRIGDKLGMTWEEFWQHLRTNPCGEILLMALMGQFCNLSEVVVRAGDTMKDLIRKVVAAVWMGAMQASLTQFPYIRDTFKLVCDEERLLGVSLTGQMDNPEVLTEVNLRLLRSVAISACQEACQVLGIKMSVAVTTGKPSGTVSQLVNCASGAHPRFARHYIRRYRIAAVDPLFRMLRDQGVKFTPENGQGPEAVERKRRDLIAKGRSESEARILVPDWNEDQVMTWVCAFPIKAPEGCITRHSVTAIDQLKWYLKVKENWCEHNQSITIYVKDEEWPSVGAFVWENFDRIVGVSFLPFDGGHYQQAPYEEIGRETYDQMLAEFPRIDYSQLSRYEQEDNTTGAQAFACVSGACEIP